MRGMRRDYRIVLTVAGGMRTVAILKTSELLVVSYAACNS